MSRSAPLAWMVGAVVLQIAGAALMNSLADARLELTLVGIALGVGAVIGLNMLRLLVWGVAHRRYPLSRTFPLSSLFFPATVALALFWGETVAGPQLAGAALVTAGTAWLTVQGGDA